MLRPEKTQKLTTRFERSDRAEVRLLLIEKNLGPTWHPRMKRSAFSLV